jgi:hypothetical protein
MSYNTNKPAPDDDMNISQGDIQADFRVANTVFGVDHFPLDDTTASAGKHRWLQMPVREVVAPAEAGQGTIFSAVGGFGSEAQVFWRFASPSRPQLQLTGSQVTADRNGTVPLYGGCQLQWGRATLKGAVGTPIKFRAPFSKNCFSVVFVLFNFSGSPPLISIISKTLDGFKAALLGATSAQIQWIAIGN